MNPDNFSGVYHKGLNPKSRGFAGGGNPPNVSKEAALIIGRIFLTIIMSFWGLTLAYFTVNVFSPGALDYGPYSEPFSMAHGLSCFLTFLTLPAFFLGEMMMRREFPQRNWILGLTFGPLILIMVGSLLYGLGSLFF